MSTLKDSNIFTPSGNGTGVRGDFWASMVFTAGSSYTITHVTLPFKETGDTGSHVFTVSIRACTTAQENDVPTGPDLCSGTIAGSLFTSTWTWHTISLGDGTALVSGTQYAIIFYTDSDDGPTVSGRWSTVADNYANGHIALSTNGGSAWTASTVSDCAFKTYAVVPTPPTTGERVTYKRLVAAANNKIFYEDL